MVPGIHRLIYSKNLKQNQLVSPPNTYSAVAIEKADNN